jgi:hypothetical protein
MTSVADECSEGLKLRLSRASSHEEPGDLIALTCVLTLTLEMDVRGTRVAHLPHVLNIAEVPFTPH